MDVLMKGSGAGNAYGFRFKAADGQEHLAEASLSLPCEGGRNLIGLTVDGAEIGRGGLKAMMNGAEIKEILCIGPLFGKREAGGGSAESIESEDGETLWKNVPRR